jgi:hypothetical protein
MARPKLQQHVITTFDADKLQRAVRYLEGLNDELALDHARDLRKVEAKLRKKSKQLFEDKGGAPKSTWTTDAEQRYGETHIADSSKRNAHARSVFNSLTARPDVTSPNAEREQWNQVRNHLKRYNDSLKKM